MKQYVYIEFFEPGGRLKSNSMHYWKDSWFDFIRNELPVRGVYEHSTKNVHEEGETYFGNLDLGDVDFSKFPGPLTDLAEFKFHFRPLTEGVGVIASVAFQKPTTDAEFDLPEVKHSFFNRTRACALPALENLDFFERLYWIAKAWEDRGTLMILRGKHYNEPDRTATLSIGEFLTIRGVDTYNFIERSVKS